jgi:hypothetical protein
VVGIVVGVASLCFNGYLSCYNGLQKLIGSCMSLWTHSPSLGVASCKENWCNKAYNWEDHYVFKKIRILITMLFIV